MSYVPQPGSKAEAAINYIARKGSGRSADIAAAIGIEAKNIPGTLASAVANGALVACDIEIPGKQAQKEYRIGGGMAPTALSRRDFTINPAKRPPRPEGSGPGAHTDATPTQPRPTARESRNVDLAKSLQVTTAVAATRSGRAGHGMLRAEILSALNASEVALTAAQIAEKKGLDSLKVTRAMTNIVKEGVVDYVKPDGIRAYFRTNQGITDLRTNNADLRKKSAGASRKTRKPKSQRETVKPVKNIPQIIPAPLPALPPTNFRCGIFSDGALRLDGDFPIDNAGVVINREQTTVLVAYLRKLGELELA